MNYQLYVDVTILFLNPDTFANSRKQSSENLEIFTVECLTGSLFPAFSLARSLPRSVLDTLLGDGRRRKKWRSIFGSKIRLRSAHPCSKNGERETHKERAFLKWVSDTFILLCAIFMIRSVKKSLGNSNFESRGEHLSTGSLEPMAKGG